MRQLGDIDFVESQVRRIAAEVNMAGIPIRSVPTSSMPPPTARYEIAQDTKKTLVLGEWLANHTDDPALKVWKWAVLHKCHPETLMQRHRTSSHISSNTFVHACMSLMGLTITIITVISLSEMASSTSIQSCESTL